VNGDTLFYEMQNYLYKYALDLEEKENRERLAEPRIYFDYDKDIFSVVVGFKRRANEPMSGFKEKEIETPYGKMKVRYIYFSKYVIVDIIAPYKRRT